MIHPCKTDILNGLELDFYNKIMEKPYSTIILAGENGCGKTTILYEIYQVRDDVSPYLKASPVDAENLRDLNDNWSFEYLYLESQESTKDNKEIKCYVYECKCRDNQDHPHYHYKIRQYFKEEFDKKCTNEMEEQKDENCNFPQVKIKGYGGYSPFISNDNDHNETSVLKMLQDLYIKDSQDDKIENGRISRLKKAFDRFFAEENLELCKHPEITIHPINANFLEAQRRPYAIPAKDDKVSVLIKPESEKWKIKFFGKITIQRNQDINGIKEIDSGKAVNHALRRFYDIAQFSHQYPQQDTNFSFTFNKKGEKFNIHLLSSGEQRIVLMASNFLFPRKEASPQHNGGIPESISPHIVLVDEPELSMHPKWQKRILKYYQDLLSVDKVDENGNPIKNEKGEIAKEQTAQLIVATHSQHIIESAMTGANKDDTLIIILKEALKEKDGKIEPTYVYSTDNGFCVKKDRAEENDAPENDDFIFNDSPTPAEVNYIVFGISSPDYHQHLYAYLQVKKHKNILDIDTYIHEQIEAKIYENIKKIKALGVNKDNFEKGMKDWSKKESWLKEDTYNGTTWKTLPTYIRNTIDHLYKDNENDKRHYTPDELEMSIELLRVIINKLKTEGGIQSL